MPSTCPYIDLFTTASQGFRWRKQLGRLLSFVWKTAVAAWNATNMGLQDDVPLVVTASQARQRSTASAGPRNETEEHWLLKRLALGWAYEQGFNCISFEVRAPRSPYRVDVAGYRPAEDQGSPIVALFECKQNRPDLNRDSAQTIAIETELRGLQERRQNLERLLAVHFPNARTSSSLFPEWDPFDPETLPHAGYRRVIRRITALQRKLEGNTKFERVIRYRLANLHFLVAPAGLVRSERVPPGWGLLEAVENERLELGIQPRFYSITNGLDWLERICRNSTVRWLKAVGVVAAEAGGPDNRALETVVGLRRPSPLAPLSGQVTQG